MLCTSIVDVPLPPAVSAIPMPVAPLTVVFATVAPTLPAAVDVTLIAFAPAWTSSPFTSVPVTFVTAMVFAFAPVAPTFGAVPALIRLRTCVFTVSESATPWPQIFMLFWLRVIGAGTASRVPPVRVPVMM